MDRYIGYVLTCNNIWDHKTPLLCVVLKKNSFTQHCRQWPTLWYRNEILTYRLSKLNLLWTEIKLMKTNSVNRATVIFAFFYGLVIARLKLRHNVCIKPKCRRLGQGVITSAKFPRNAMVAMASKRSWQWNLVAYISYCSQSGKYCGQTQNVSHAGFPYT